MKTNARIVVTTPDGDALNGLGTMVSQYLEQEFAEFPEKAAAASRIRCVIGMEMDRGVAVTISFLEDQVLVQNGVLGKTDLHIKGEYLVLSGVLCGTTNPFLGVLKGSIQLLGIPRRPFQALRVLRLLKIQEPGAKRLALMPQSPFLWMGASVLSVGVLSFLAYLVLSR